MSRLVYYSMPGLIKKLIGLCKVTKEERVALLSTSVFDKEHLDAYMVSLSELGIDYVRLVLPPRPDGIMQLEVLDDPMGPYAVDAVKKANMVICVIEWSKPISLLPSLPRPYMKNPWFGEVIKAGVRWLDVMLPNPELNFRRLFPTENLVNRVRRGAGIMDKAKRMRITSEAGTDLTLDKTGRKANGRDGIVDEPGTWDNFGFAMVNSYPLEDSAQGKLVLDVGDYNLKIGDVTDRVELTIKDGFITRIEGGFSARLLERWLAQWNEPEMYGTSHIGWGAHVEGGVWTDSKLFCVADAESYPGIMQIAFGSSPSRKTTSHVDLECRNTSFYLDGELICDKGKIVHKNCL